MYVLKYFLISKKALDRLKKATRAFIRLDPVLNVHFHVHTFLDVFDTSKAALKYFENNFDFEILRHP